MFARLSKSRYLAGLQCRKYLWWQVHDPVIEDSDEPDVRIEHGRRVGQAAREFLPGGVLIEGGRREDRLDATRRALAAGASRIYEACFEADDVFVAVDILERDGDGFSLIEVKASVDVKDHHLQDVAVQLHVLGRAGLDVKRVEIMHLNRECRYPDLSNLFVRENVTDAAREAAGLAPPRIRDFVTLLAGDVPQVEFGDHCESPWPCPFKERCWPLLPPHHVSTLYRISAKARKRLLGDGCDTLFKLPPDYPAKGPAKRQIEAVRTGKLVVEPGLGEALSELEPPHAFLDFETISLPIPIWPGCRPYQQVPVQFSCHVHIGTRLKHRYWLAEGADDPREAFANALIDACLGAKSILVYHAVFERGRIAELAEALPDLASDLIDVKNRLCDLRPIVHDHVYHPDFNGSFSIKSVLPALVPGAGYADLEFQDGGTASAALETLLLDPNLPESERATLREHALAYCERDTFAMVQLFDRLKELAERQ